MCVLDRKFSRQKLRSKIESLADSLAPEVEKHLNKIDFENKRWKASGIRCNQITSKEDAVNHIVEMRNEILEAMLKHKDIIHDENDPEEIEYLGEVFDVRLWDLEELRQKYDSEKEVVDDLHSTLAALIDKSEDFLIDEDLHSLKSELRACITILVQCSNLRPVIRILSPKLGKRYFSTHKSNIFKHSWMWSIG